MEAIAKRHLVLCDRGYWCWQMRPFLKVSCHDRLGIVMHSAFYFGDCSHIKIFLFLHHL